MNKTLFLAEEILQVLQSSGQALDSQLVATEIVVNLLKAEPYGSLAQVSYEMVEHSEVASQSRCTAYSEGQSDLPRQSHHSAGTVEQAARP